jgi:kumamolisin
MRGVAVLALLVLASIPSAHAASPRVVKHGSMSPRVDEASDRGRSPASTEHGIVVGLELRNRDALEAFLTSVQDPASPDYGRFLTQEEFNALYAPTRAAEEGLVAHLRASGLRVTHRAPNRLVVGAVGSVAALERAFGVEIHDVSFRGRPHFAAVNEPSLPADLAPAVAGVLGLDDLSAMHSRVGDVLPAVAPHAALGSNCCHLSPIDLATLYDDTAGYNGAGQTVAIAGAYAWSDSDNNAFNAQWGLPALPAGSGQICVGSSTAATCKFSSQNSIEIALDVEYAHGTAPGARILNYMAASTSFADFAVTYNRIVTDNPGHVVTTSWGACEAGVSVATQQTNDNIFANANAVGQSWFAASGDNGSRDCSNLLTVDHPANSPHVMGTGGTTPTCSSGMTPANPGCGGYGSETGWSGSGGGVSQLFARPAFQTGCGVPAGTQRLVPDVALESDTSPGNYVAEGGFWYIVGGTSGAAPQWAGLLAELNQKESGAGLGNPGARLYGLCGTSAFHDVIAGSNGDYSAGPGYDLVTGIGSAEARNLLGGTGTTLPSTTTTLPPTTTSTTPTTTSTTTSTTLPPTTSSTTLLPTTSTTVSTTSSTSLAPTTSTSVTTTSSTSVTTTTSTSSTTTTTLRRKGKPH